MNKYIFNTKCICNLHKLKNEWIYEQQQHTVIHTIRKEKQMLNNITSEKKVIENPYSKVWIFASMPHMLFIMWHYVKSDLQ